MRLHDLRHTFASYAVMEGHSIPMVAALLGHKKVSMTLRLYHVWDEVVEQAAERLGDIFKAIVSQAKPLSQSDTAPKRASKAKPKPKTKSITLEKVKQATPLSIFTPLTESEIRAVRAWKDNELLF